jgi:hypothetical protein
MVVHLATLATHSRAPGYKGSMTFNSGRSALLCSVSAFFEDILRSLPTSALARARSPLRMSYFCLLRCCWSRYLSKALGANLKLVAGSTILGCLNSAPLLDLPFFTIR